MALQHFVDVADARFEFHEVGTLVIREGHFGEHGHRVGELCQIDVSLITADVPGGLQAFDTLQARAGRQSNGFGEADIGHAPVLLQLDQDVDVDTVELGCSVH
ncbi:hypothetical protein D3C78_1712570 [compost metagenome]